MKKYFSIIIIFSIFLTACSTATILRFPPSRWISDSDTEPVKIPKKRWSYDYLHDTGSEVAYNAGKVMELTGQTGGIFNRGIVGLAEEALNTNNFDEVPDSSWFKNTIGRYDVSPEDITDILRDSDLKNVNFKLVINKIFLSKTHSTLIASDDQGNLYTLSLDAPGRAEITTAISLISNHIVGLAGYNVPQSAIAYVRKANLTLAKDAVQYNVLGKSRSATPKDLEEVLAEAGQAKSTTIRVLITKRPEGLFLGPFSFSGTKSSDSNDIIPHEHRRELRGFRIIASFVDYTTAIESHTADFFIETHGFDGYTKHYICNIESMSYEANRAASELARVYGDEINLMRTEDPTEILEAANKARQKKTDKIMLVSSENFNPAAWHPTFENEAFSNLTYRDAIWGTKIVQRFSDKLIEAIVAEAKLSNPKLVLTITNLLKQRRNKIVEVWFSKLPPLDQFELTSNGTERFILSFKDLSPHPDTRYRFRVMDDLGKRILQDWRETTDTKLVIGIDATSKIKQGKLMKIIIEGKKPDSKFWGPSVDVYMKKEPEPIIWGIIRRY